MIPHKIDAINEFCRKVSRGSSPVVYREHIGNQIVSTFRILDTENKLWPTLYRADWINKEWKISVVSE